MPIIHEIKTKWNQYWDVVCPMHNLAAVFDPRIKLNRVPILLDEIDKYMNHNFEASKIEVTQLLYDIFILYDKKIHRSRRSTSSSQPTSSTSYSSSVFSFLARRRHSHASSSSLSNELKFYL